MLDFNNKAQEPLVYVPAALTFLNGRFMPLHNFDRIQNICLNLAQYYILTFRKGCIMAVSIKYDQLLVQRVVNEVIATVNSVYSSRESVLNALITTLKKAFEKENINLVLAESAQSNFTHLLWEALGGNSIKFTTTTMVPLSNPAAGSYEEFPYDYESTDSVYNINLNDEREKILRGIFKEATEELKKLTGQEVINIIKTLPEDLRFDYYQRYSQIKGASVDKQILVQMVGMYDVSRFPLLIEKLGIIGARLLYNDLPQTSAKSQAFLQALSHVEQGVLLQQIQSLRKAAKPLQDAINMDDASSEKEHRKLEKKAIPVARELAKQREQMQRQQKRSEDGNVNGECLEQDAPMETTPLMRKK